MRIAFLADPDSPGGYYRAIAPMLALSARGHDAVQMWRPNDRPRPELAAGCDLLHVYRSFDDGTVQLVQAAKRRGMAVVYDNDDDLHEIARNNVRHRQYRGFAGEQATRRRRRIVQLADLAIASSPPVAERFREYGAAHVRLIENYVPDAALSVSGPPSREWLVAGWLAGQEHHVDIEQLPLREAFERLLDAYPQLVIETIGVSLGMRHERYRNERHVDFLALPGRMARFDIGLAPIADIPFNRARSSIKVKEYAVLGRPWLASPVGPYAPLGEREGGRLVSDGGWFEAVARLIDKPRERRKLAKRARAWGRRQAMSAHAHLWEEALAEAIERARRPAQIEP